MIQKIGVVGCGLMGSGIAEVAARRGLDVVVTEGDEANLSRGRSRIQNSLARALKASKISEDDLENTLSRIRYDIDLGAHFDRELVVEAIIEDEAAKVGIFSTLDKVVEADNAILASNTSSIPIMKLGVATNRPEQVIGIHFFNPVPVLSLVELVTSLLTSEEVASRAAEFASQSLKKHVIHSKDRAGFIVNALLIPYILSAIRMMESGFATAEDIDTGMIEGCAHPMGPLALCDLIGLDTTAAVADSLYHEFKEPLYAPPPLLLRMVDAGLLGRKSGRGFYEYKPRA
ncbi:MAG: 3-hydroxybutyryl-CoA dehydrogenase [Acidimicrobiaceae bacterium]|nr:3-hydroxybutyryl-CoA dehydrogenase [Acidimicrobiaceae bacterium]